MQNRRELLTGMAASAAGLPLATILADPKLAQASASLLERRSLTLSNGKAVDAYLGLPKRTPAPAVVLFHEWWGLNDQIKAVAQEFTEIGYVALAIDLFGGKVATVRNDAKRLIGRVGRAETLELSRKWLQWLKSQETVNGKLATIGWCFGGGWALSAATVEPVDATVVYYGRVNHPTSEMRHLKGPVMGHFATHDMWINRDMVTLFELGMLKAQKRSISHWYEAGHAFANPTGSRYNDKNAVLAWQRTLAFLETEFSRK